MLGVELNSAEFLNRAAQELLRVNPEELSTFATLIYECYENDQTVFIFERRYHGQVATIW